MENLFGWCEFNPLAQALCKHIFEPHAMRLLELGGPFVCRKLLSTCKRSVKGEELIIDIPESHEPRYTAERVQIGQTADQLYVPQSTSEGGIDAWIPNFGAFVFAVGKPHGITDQAAADVKKLGNRLFFLLPPNAFPSFTRKTIEQFGICIPFPAELE